jgi:hypothetical protein
VKAVIAIALATTTASAAPFDGLFHAQTKQLACTGEARGVDEVTCTITRLGPHSSRLACTGGVYDELAPAFESAVLVGNSHGIWRAKPGAKIDPKQPPWLAIPPAISHWEQDDDPQRYSGIQHFTIAHDRDWCAAWWPFGYGGAPKAYAVCVSPDGALTGFAAIKNESRIWSIRCGDAPDPESLLPNRLQP